MGSIHPHRQHDCRALGVQRIDTGSDAELLEWFPDEGACLDYLEWLRWPDGFRCPRRAGRAGWRLSGGRWECAVCGRQASVTAGTIFHRTRTPLRMWFAAAWQMASQKHGVSALGVQRSLGLGSYQMAWAILRRYRTAMTRPRRERLAGLVEVDETKSAVSKPESTAGRPLPSRSSRSRAGSSTQWVSGGFDCNGSTMSRRTA